MNTLNYNINTNNNDNNVIKENESLYDMNTKNFYNNINKGHSLINENYSIHLQDNTLNHNINIQDNNLLHINNNLNIQNTNYVNSLLNNRNDIYELNTTQYSQNENESLNSNSVSSYQTYNNNNNQTIISINNANNDNKIIEATQKIPIIRLYIFIKKIKAKCVFKFLYQISYILNLFDLNKRRNFINTIPFKLPKILEKIFLINFPIKVIENILPSYKNYHIPTTQEIISPFLELILSFSSIPNGVNTTKNNRLNELSSTTVENNSQAYVNSIKSIGRDSTHSKNSKCSISPLLLPQSELPCHESPENALIIQTPTSFLKENEYDDKKTKAEQNYDISINESEERNNNISYIDEIINSDSVENNDSNSFRISKQHANDNLNPSSLNLNKNDELFTELYNNDITLKMNLNSISKNESIGNSNHEQDNETPYNFLTNNMKYQSNLTLFPLSPYITLKSSDFETDIKPVSSHTTENNKSTNNNILNNGNYNKKSKSTDSLNSLNVSSNTVTTLSTVAASIAALKSSSTSLKHNESSLSKNDKKNLSKIKNSNIVKNIVKNFEEINNFYKNSLLKAAEKTNNTKSSRRNSKKDEDDNNSSCDENENDNIIILEENDNNDQKLNEIDNQLNIDKIIDNNETINENIENVLEPNFMHELEFTTIKESSDILNSYIYDTTSNPLNIHMNNDDNNNNNDNDNDNDNSDDDGDCMTEIIKDFSLANNFEDDSDSSNSEASNAIFNSIINIEDLDITRLTILLIENFIKLSDVEKDEFLNSEYFELIKNHVMNIQNDDEIEYNSIFKDPKMLNEFESHIEALQQCVKERDDIINYYYQEIVNERIQNEKLLVFCENEQLERQETNKIISGLTKKIEMEEDYIKKLEVRCDMLIEKIKKYQSCCKHYEKSISLLSGNKSNSLKLITPQNWKMNNDLTEPLSVTSFVPSAASIVAAANTNNPNSSNPSTSSSSTTTMINNSNNNESKPGIAHLINKLSCEKISKNEEIQYLKSLLKSYNGKHIYINENVIKRQIIEKTNPSTSHSIPATVDGVPVIPINSKSNKTTKVNLKTRSKSKSRMDKDLSGKKMMMEKYLNDEKQQHFSKMEDTIVINEDELEIEMNKNDEIIQKYDENNNNNDNNNYYYNEEDEDNEENEENVEEEQEQEIDDVDDDLLKNIGKSIDLSIIEDLNIFNEKHYQEKILNKHQEYTKYYDVKGLHEDDTFSEYAPTLVN